MSCSQVIIIIAVDTKKLMIGLLQVPGLNLSSAVHYKSEADKNLLAPIASLLEGQYSQKALQVTSHDCQILEQCFHTISSECFSMDIHKYTHSLKA